MNYLAIYKNIIDRAITENRIKGGDIYYERHHIIPRCVGGTNNKQNLVLLTSKEHFICHKLLCEIYPDQPKLKYAVWAMLNIRELNKEKQSRNYRIGVREYERLRSEYVNELMTRENWIPPFKGKKHTEEAKRKNSEKHRGKRTPLSDVTKKKISEKLTDHFKNNEHHMKGSIAWNRGITHTKEVRDKIRASVSKEPKEQIICPHCNKSGGKPVMKRFHFDNCKTLG